MTTPDKTLGQCLCGAVQFKVEGDPIYTVICHCENCKRTSGSTLYTASIYLRKQYQLVKPASSDITAELENVTVYTDCDTLSGKPLYRRFCSICGSPLYALTPLSDEIISVAAGVLPRAGKEWTPQTEQFIKDKVDWVPDLGNLIQSLHGPDAEAIRTRIAG